MAAVCRVLLGATQLFGGERILCVGSWRLVGNGRRRSDRWGPCLIQWLPVTGDGCRQPLVTLEWPADGVSSCEGDGWLCPGVVSGLVTCSSVDGAAGLQMATDFCGSEPFCHLPFSQIYHLARIAGGGRWEWLTAEEVCPQDIVSVIGGVAGGSKQGRKAAWKFIRDNWEKLYNRYQGAFLMSRLIKLSVDEFAVDKMATEVKAFFESHPVPSAERTIQQCCENILLNAAWLKCDAENVHQYLLQCKASPTA
ncbi:hypothetical protein E2320_022747, partial [Naja naja]